MKIAANELSIDSAVLKDLRLIIGNNHRFRVSFKAQGEGGNPIPVDLIVDYTNPRLEKLSLVITLTGEEQRNGSTINATLAFDFVKRAWLVYGRATKAGEFRREAKSIPELIGHVKRIALIMYSQNHTS